MTVARRPNQNEQEFHSLEIELPGGNAVGATTTITCVANASMVDTDFFALNDGQRIVTYEYDKAGDGVTAGRAAWAVAGGAAGAIQAAGTLKTAIEANQPLFTVLDNADGTLTLTNKSTGVVGNVTQAADNVANAGFTLTASAGGLDAKTVYATSATKKLGSAPRAYRVDECEYINPVGLAGHADNYWEIALLRGQALVVADTVFTAEADDEKCTAAAHGLLTGDGPFQVSNASGALPTGFVAATDYWIIKFSANVFYLASSLANALAGTKVTISTDGTGTQTIADTALTKRQTVMAQWSTDSDAQGTLAADKIVAPVLSATSANLVAADGDVLTIALTKVASAANLPAGRFVVHGRYV